MDFMHQHRHKVAATVWSAWAVNILDRYKTFALLPLIVASLAMTNQQTGWVMFAFFASFAVCQPVAGWLTDWLGPKKTLAISVASFSIFTWSMALVTNWEQLLYRNVLFGFGIGFETAAVYRLIPTWYPTHSRGRASAIASTGISFGAIFAPFIVVPVAQALGSWRWSFMLVSFLGLPVLWAIEHYISDRPERDPRVSKEELEYIFGAEELARKRAQVFDPTKARSEEELPPGERVVPLRKIFLSRSMVLASMATFLQYIIITGLSTWLPTYAVQQLKMPLLLAGTLLSLMAVGGGLGMLAGGYMSDRVLGTLRTPIWIICGIITAALLLIISQIQAGVSIVVLSIVFFGAGFFTTNASINGPLCGPYLAELLTPGAVGRASGAIVLCSQIGGAFSQLLIARLIIQTPQGTQYWPVFICFACIGIVGAVLTAAMVEPKVKRSYLMYLLSGRKEGTWQPH